MVLNGAQRLQPVFRNRAPRNRLSITPTILGQLHGIWVTHQDRAYGAMIWAAASTCFFGFFRSGEITIPSVSSLASFPGRFVGGGKKEQLSAIRSAYDQEDAFAWSLTGFGKSIEYKCLPFYSITS